MKPQLVKTLRDEFAIAALTGLTSRQNLDPNGGENYISELAYRIADYMLRKREK